MSSGNWFEPKSLFTVFFPGSVRGLNKGAAVTFRGVKIGEVKDVTAFLTGQDQPPIQIEVVIEIRHERGGGARRASRGRSRERTPTRSPAG